MFTLRELTDLFDISPEMPPPLPRQRHPPKGGTVPPTFKPAPSHPPTLARRILNWIRPPAPDPKALPRPPHPFMAIKAGKKTVIIAVVDAGSTSFFRFGQGAFSEWAIT
jgi:tRNA-splicing endonuclease subunit Sen54